MSARMKKIYTIEILPTNKRNIWYASKVGKQYEAELVCKSYDDVRQTGIPVFEVNPCNFVFPVDCIVVDEKVIEQYVKL